MTDPHDMVGIGCPKAKCTHPTPEGQPTRMTVRSMDVSARMETSVYFPDDDVRLRKWFVLWLVGGAVLFFSPDPDPGPEMRSTR